MNLHKKRLTRKQFEALFAGEWKPEKGDRFRRNGAMLTRVMDGKKVWRNRQFAVSAKTWYEIAKALKLVQ